jgi:hypothetical protein
MSNLPTTAEEAETRFYARYGPSGVATWSGVQQILGRNRPRPQSVEDWIALAEDVRERLSAAPTTLREAASALTAPFALDQIAIKPGAVTKDKTKALALPYVDLRTYQDRLDAVVGIENWSVEYRSTAGGLICRLTILGVSKEDIGEPSSDGDNPATEALAQSFKRACTAFGLGRYLYHLPNTWADYDEMKKSFKDAERAVYDIYKRAGLI